MVKNGKRVVASGFIYHLNSFSVLRNHPIWNWCIKRKMLQKALLKMS